MLPHQVQKAPQAPRARDGNFILYCAGTRALQYNGKRRCRTKFSSATMDKTRAPSAVHFAEEAFEFSSVTRREPGIYESSQPVTPATSTPVSRRSSFEHLADTEFGSTDQTRTLLRHGIQGRPAVFSSLSHELVFVLLCSSGQLITQINFGNVTVTLLKIQESLRLQDTQLPWLTGAFSLANGAFVIFFGSLADKVGAKKVFIGGSLWLCLWSLAAGLTRSPIQLFVSRAMQGIAGGALIPSGIGLLGYIYEPGVRKNRVFSAFGAMAPLGFILGAVEGGVVTAFTDWRWMFLFNAMLLLPFSIAAYFVIPPDNPRSIRESLRGFDWLGSVVAISGLTLIVFGLTDGPVASWAPYTYSLLIIGVLLLVIFVFIEKFLAENPIMPLEIWRTKSFPILMVATVLGWSGYSAWQYHCSLFWLRIKQASPLLTAAYFGPNGIVGIIATFICASTLHILPGHYIFAVSCLAFATGGAFFIPLSYYPALSYWYTGFICLILTTFGPDLSFASASIFVTSNVKRKYQGTAGSVVNTVINLAQSLGVGVAGIVETAALNARHSGSAPWTPTEDDILASYRAAWWFSTAIALAGFLLTIICVRIPKTDEKMHEA